jgi:6-phosphofructokinase 1
MVRSKRRAVGILTGGRDCPGLNAVIRAATRTALEHEWEIYGIEDGFDGLVRRKVGRLRRADVRGDLAQSGTILGTTNCVNPFEYPVRRRRIIVEDDRSADVVRNFHALGLAGLIVVGGEGTLALADRFHRKGIPIVGVPKTIDNDLAGTALSFGFDTAVQTATDAIDKLQPSAAAHKRVMVVEVVGRNTGWIALHAGVAGGADVILVPEIPFHVDRVAATIRARERSGQEYSLVVVAEGASPAGGRTRERAPREAGQDARAGGVGDAVADDLARLLKRETRSLAVGHLQRGGPPSAFDRLFATSLGTTAMRLVNEGLFGNMVALKPPTLAPVPLHQVVGKTHRVPLDSDIVRCARDLGTGFGD